MKTPKEIRAAKFYSDIFSDDEKKAKQEYRAYAKKYHPDFNPPEDELDIFDIINTLYNKKHINGTGKGVTDNTINFIDKETGKGFEMSNPVVIKTSIGNVYHTSTKIVFEYDKTYEKFYENFINQVRKLKYKDDEMDKQFRRMFPKIIRYFETEDNKLCILQNKTKDVLNLDRILQAYKIKGEPFPERQAAWILNRLYNLECYLKYYNKASNGISMENIWVSPEYHTVLLLGGWEYTLPKHEKMLGCPKDVYKTLPIKVRDSKESSTLTDLESIKAIGRRLFADHKDLDNIWNFLNTGTEDDNVLDVWGEYKEALEKHFGKRKFVVWENVPYNC